MRSGKKKRGRPKGAKNLPQISASLPKCPVCNGASTVKVRSAHDFPGRSMMLDGVLYRGINIARWRCTVCRRRFNVRTPLPTAESTAIITQKF